MTDIKGHITCEGYIKFKNNNSVQLTISQVSLELRGHDEVI